jgi:hypothetical protein
MSAYACSRDDVGHFSHLHGWRKITGQAAIPSEVSRSDALRSELLILLSFRILSLCSKERKYFGSGSASKMADKDDPFPVLRDTVIFAVNDLPLAVIPQAVQDFEDCAKRPSFVMAKKAFDVFK